MAFIAVVSVDIDRRPSDANVQYSASAFSIYPIPTVSTKTNTDDYETEHNITYKTHLGIGDGGGRGARQGRDGGTEEKGKGR